MKVRTHLFASALAMLAMGGQVPVHAAATHTLKIANRVGKFQAFYTQATAQPIDAEARWKLWQKDDGIAAVPPGPAGEAMARQLLDAAWARYPGLMPKLPAMERNAELDAHEAFARINRLLKTQGTPIHSRLVLYVGQFDNNAYSVPPMDGHPATVMMPVENAQLRLELAHELTHTVHMQLAHVHNSFGAPLGETMFLEGLAMRTAQQVFPGAPDAAYTEMPGDLGWLARCQDQQAAILADITPDVGKQGHDIAMKYTFGLGNHGMHREAYCAAWIVMGQLLHAGHSLSGLARIPEAQMVATIRTALRSKAPAVALGRAGH